MVNGENFKWFKAQVDAAQSDEAAEPEDDSIDRWADDGGNLAPLDNEAYRRDFPEVEIYCERTGCFQPGTVPRLIPVTNVRYEWKHFCTDHNPLLKKRE